MKRRNFFATLGLATAMVAVPSIVSASTITPHAHIPADYAEVAEEAEELQEFDVDLSDRWYAMDIVWS